MPRCVAGFFLPVFLILFPPHVCQCLYDLPGRLLYVALCIASDCSRGVYGVPVSVLIFVSIISRARYVYHACPVYVSTAGSFRACGFSVRTLPTTVCVGPCQPVSMLADPCCASLSLVVLFWERDPCVFVWVSSLSRVSFLRLGVWRSKCDKVSRTTGQSGRGA